MNAKERVMNRLEGRPVDRIPNLNIVMAFASKFIDKPFDQFCLDYRVLVEANIKTAEAFGIDIMNTMSDAYREAYDYGAEISFPYDSLPLSKKPLIETPADIRKLKPFDPLASTRMLDRIKAITLYKREIGNDYPIMGWVEGMIAEASDLRGMNNVMMDFFDNPELLNEIMDICLETAITSAKAQIEEGADIIGIGDAAASLVGPNLYREKILPYEQNLIKSIHGMGAKTRLHICGNIGPLLDDMKHSGADIIDIDWMVDFKTACKKLEGYASACGNFDPVSIVMQGTPQTIKAAVKECVNSGNETTFIMAGCEIPISTPHENLKAVHEALCD